MALMVLDYPLPPNEEKIEILRVVVRESMPMDLLDRLICDICAVTEAVMKIENDFDIAAWQAFPSKTSSSKGTNEAGRRPTLATTYMTGGMHRSVC
jgi:glutamate decarboxylase